MQKPKLEDFGLTERDYKRIKKIEEEFGAGCITNVIAYILLSFVLFIIGREIGFIIFVIGGWLGLIFLSDFISHNLIKVFYFGLNYKFFKKKRNDYDKELWQYKELIKSEVTLLINQLNIQKKEILSYPEQNTPFKLVEILKRIATYRENVSKMLLVSNEVAIYDDKLKIDIEKLQTFASEKDLAGNLYLRNKMTLLIDEANEKRKSLTQHIYEFSERAEIELKLNLYKAKINEIISLDSKLPDRLLSQNDSSFRKNIENHKKILESTYFENEVYLQSIKNSAYKIYQNLFYFQIDKQEKEKLIKDYQSIVEKGKPYYQVIKGNMGIDYFRFHLYFSQKENALFLIDFSEQLKELNELKLLFHGRKFNQDLADKFIEYNEKVKRLYESYLSIPLEFGGFHKDVEHHKEYAEKRILDAEFYEPTNKQELLPKKVITQEREINLKETKPVTENIIPITDSPLTSNKLPQPKELKVQTNLFGEVINPVDLVDTSKKKENIKQQVELPIKNDTLLIQDIALSEIKIVKKRQKKFEGKKIDYELRNQKAREIGLKGEILALLHETEFLKNSLNPNLVEKIVHISQIEGDGVGYDILSFSTDGKIKYIEVKTTKGGLETQFDLTDNEIEFMKQNPENYYLYRIYDYNEINNTGKCYIVKGQVEFDNFFELKPKNYVAKAKGKFS